jgi:hypothetical protein
MSSVERLCSYARNVCSWGYKLVKRGYRAQVPVASSVRFVSPCDGCPPLPFIDARVRDKKGKQICAIVLRSWVVFSYVVVCQEALKGTELWWSSRSPCV